MASLGNAPSSNTLLRLMARKSFALGLFIQDTNGRSLNIQNSTIRIVVRKQTMFSSDTPALLNEVATIVSPQAGFARFHLQAADLDFPTGEYDFTISIVDQGYSSVAVQGIIEIVPNTEIESVDEVYLEDAISQSMQIVLMNQNSVIVRTGPALAPGGAAFTTDLEAKILALYAGATLDELTTADDIPDGTVHVMMTLAERQQLANLSFDWNDISGKPAFGDIITHNVSEFLQPEGVDAADITSGVISNARLPRLSELRGFSHGTAAPSGGDPGDIYFQHD